MSEIIDFRIKDIFQSDDSSPDFYGLLELLLALIHNNKVSIQDVNISDITDQYIEFINITDRSIEADSEFVQLASYLLLLKSKLLLSKDKQIEELDELKASLENLEYSKKFESITKVINLLKYASESGLNYYSGGCHINPEADDYSIPHNVNELTFALMEIFPIDNSEKMSESIVQSIPRAFYYSVTDKTKDIISALKISKSLDFNSFFYNCKTKNEIVVVFISLLELCSVGNICIKNDGTNITVEMMNEEVTAKLEELS